MPTLHGGYKGRRGSNQRLQGMVEEVVDVDELWGSIGFRAAI